MAFIRIVDEDEATGALAREYEEARERAGKVFNVVKIQSLRPRVMRTCMQLYMAVMYGQSALSRAERELLAVVVSQTNGCHY